MDIQHRVDELEKKVLHLERQLEQLRQEQSKTQKVRPFPGSRQERRVPPDDQGREPVQGPVHSQVPKPRVDWEHLIARIWLPRVFVLVLLLGILWGFNAAVSSGILTEPVRCMLGLAAAALLFWYGEIQFRHKRQALGQVLQGGSIAILMLTLFAAHMLYELIPAPHSFVLYILSIGAGVFTAIRHRSQVLIMITLVGGYLIPFLIRSEVPDAWIFAGYEALFSVAIMIIAVLYSFRTAYFTAFFMLHIPLFALYLGSDIESIRYAYLAALIFQYAGLYILSFLKSSARVSGNPFLLFTGFALLSGWTSLLFYGDESAIYGIVIGVWALIYSITALWNFVWHKDFTIYTSIACFAWFLWLFDLLHAASLAAALIAQGTVALLLGMKPLRTLQLVTGGLIYATGLLLLLLHPIPEIISMETAGWIVLLGSTALIASVLKRLPELPYLLLKRQVWNWSGPILLLIFITQINGVLTRELSFDTRHLILSAIWALYAVAMIVSGILLKKRSARLAGIFFLFLTLAKVIYIDLPGVTLAIRAVLFMGLGAVGIAASRLLYRRTPKDHGDQAGTQDHSPI
ncbi:DUF2339 domain-containing protein [Paenibacillus sp. YPG26]|uniref:DUF2339 domain-containing protein n=1 Tax=Paenibacillus sp. YPG26 TaxID=2878915 RepID=UPI00204046F5|nr:DUF2339 domain-containing protein [Paenibacillus sp. YPG26]USB33986.1 DUF2339 domain-containing protein [Paenibacillus sp. YPG26]